MYQRSPHQDHNPLLQALMQIMQILNMQIPLCRVFGIAVRVHVLMILITMVLVLRTAFLGSGPFYFQALLALGYVFILAGSVLLHELGHCYGAYLVGGRARSILLWPLGGLASVEGSMRTPRTELVVIALGPAVSLLLAVVGTGLFFLMPPAAGHGVYDAARSFAFVFAAVNWMLFLFNMLMPMLPLDCGALLRAAFSLRYNPEVVTFRLCIVGMWVGGLAIAASLVFRELGMLLMLIGLFGVLHCWQMREMLRHGMPVYETESILYDYQRTLVSPWIAPSFKHGLLRRFSFMFDTRPAPAKTLRPKRKRTKATRQETQEPVGVVVPLNRLDRLRQQMEQAAKDEDYDKAARLRDEIRRAEEQEGSDE